MKSDMYPVFHLKLIGYGDIYEKDNHFTIID